MIPWWEPTNIIQIPGLNITIYVFGILVGIGVLCGYLIAVWRAKRLNLNQELMLEFALYVMVTALLGSHIFHVAVYSPWEFFNNPLTLLNPFGSQSSIGGFLSAFLGAYLWKLRRKVSAAIFYDQLSFGMTVGWFFGRTGCFYVHDHPGKETDFFLGVQNYYQLGLAPATRHDMGLYEALWTLGMFMLFLWLGKKTRPIGYFTTLYFTSFAILRFFLDFLRAVDEVYAGLTAAQWVCLFASGIGIYYFRRIVTSGTYDFPEGLRAK